MRTRRLGRTEMSVSRLGFGCAPLGNLYAPVTDADAFDALATAGAAGTTLFDVAPLYGHGLAEHRLGTGLRALPADTIVSTKVGRRLRAGGGGPVDGGIFAAPAPFRCEVDYGFDGVLRQVEDSLQRLGRDRVDILLIHDFTTPTNGDEHDRLFAAAMGGAYRALERLRDERVVRAIGFGVNFVPLALRFLEAGDFDCTMLAGRYTLLEQGAADRFLPACAARDVGVMLAAPFASGILATGVAGDRPPTYRYAPAPPETAARAAAIAAVCARHAVALPAAAIRFALAHPAVDTLVVGARSRAEVVANADHARAAIPAAFWAELKASGLLPSDAPVPTEEP